MTVTTKLQERSPHPQKLILRAEEKVNEILLGKPQQVRLALSCLLANGHLLIEDIPGMGKTTLAHTLSQVLGLPYSRIQFTSDLLPADVVGVSTYDRDQQNFRFHPGPVFSSVVLADEINRATAKTQSALLEAMEEGQVTVDGETHKLPEPFFVIATQNPRDQFGTFPLPESQLDRFMMRLRLGYPEPKDERRLFMGEDRRTVLNKIQPLLNGQQLIALQKRGREIHCSEALISYVQALLHATRNVDELDHGLSPRAGLALLHAAQTWAMLQGRDLVLPEDVQAVAVNVMAHRLAMRVANERDAEAFVEQLLRSVAIP